MTLLRFGLLLTLLAALGLLAGLVLPFPGDFPVPRTLAAAPAPMASWCLELSYPARPGRPLFPPFIKLTTQPAASGQWPSAGGYQAVAWPSEDPYPGLTWQPISADSLDIAYFRTGIVRLTIKPDSRGRLRGRGGWAWYPNWYYAAIEQDFPVAARPAPCEGRENVPTPTRRR